MALGGPQRLTRAGFASYDYHMSRVQTLVQLNVELIADLDAAAELTGVSRSALIREAIEAHLADRRESTISAAIAAGYKRIPQGATEEWGDIQRQTREDTRRTLERLEAEEAAAGVTW